MSKIPLHELWKILSTTRLKASDVNARPCREMGGIFDDVPSSSEEHGHIGSQSKVEFDKTTKKYHRSAAFEVLVSGVGAEEAVAIKSRVETALKQAAHILHLQRNRVDMHNDQDTEADEWSRNISAIVEQALVNTNRFMASHSTDFTSEDNSKALYESTSPPISEPWSHRVLPVCRILSEKLQFKWFPKSEQQEAESFLHTLTPGDTMTSALRIACPTVYDIAKEPEKE